MGGEMTEKEWQEWSADIERRIRRLEVKSAVISALMATNLWLLKYLLGLVTGGAV